MILHLFPGSLASLTWGWAAPRLSGSSRVAGGLLPRPGSWPGGRLSLGANNDIPSVRAGELCQRRRAVCQSGNNCWSWSVSLTVQSPGGGSGYGYVGWSEG